MRPNLVVCKQVRNLLFSSEYVRRSQRYVFLHLNAEFHHSSESSDEVSISPEWYREEFPRLAKLTTLLKNVDLVDGRLVDVNDNSFITDERLLRRMRHFKALAGAFLGHSSVQEELMRNVNAAAMAGGKCNPPLCFSQQIEREPINVNVLTKVCNFLDISAQQRKTVRLSICPQVTQYRIWTGVLEEILSELKSELELFGKQSSSRGSSSRTYMGQQIVSTCLKFLAQTAGCQDEDSSSWMRPKPLKAVDSSSTQTWQEVLDMFNDLINCLRNEERFSYHVLKLEVMKEGLTQIKDVLIDRDIGFKEVRHHENLVQKKLSKTLGHSSRCLFTLLRFYLHGTTRDMEVDVSGGLCETGEKDRLCLYMGKIITSLEEDMIWNGIKHLDRALGLFEFVWETAKIDKKLELQGHLWCVGAQSRTVEYKGNMFFIHGISINV